jgi:hypothetical protein
MRSKVSNVKQKTEGLSGILWASDHFLPDRVSVFVKDL